MYRSLERSTEDTRDGMFLYSTQASFSWPRVDLASISSALDYIIRVCESLRDSFFIWESCIGFYICCYLITTILAVYFLFEFEFRGKSCVE